MLNFYHGIRRILNQTLYGPDYGETVMFDEIMLIIIWAIYGNKLIID